MPNTGYKTLGFCLFSMFLFFTWFKSDNLSPLNPKRFINRSLKTINLKLLNRNEKNSFDIGGFDGHNNFSGRMVGHPKHHYHLEFTIHKNEKSYKLVSVYTTP
jgi:hypothetical protein